MNIMYNQSQREVLLITKGQLKEGKLTRKQSGIKALNEGYEEVLGIPMQELKSNGSKVTKESETFILMVTLGPRLVQQIKHCHTTDTTTQRMGYRTIANILRL